ncbi:hypothetical protein [Streptomyces sp. SID5468]|uniref:hypothetical protein n=1 Tax=Streptomyces sp. SID5468 TaxID=2690295 RepID=UPI0019296A7D|nr:hypothetical protein [Streptomyces sp. SID5468]
MPLGTAYGIVPLGPAGQAAPRSVRCALPLAEPGLVVAARGPVPPVGAGVAASVLLAAPE